MFISVFGGVFAALGACALFSAVRNEKLCNLKVQGRIVEFQRKMVSRKHKPMATLYAPIIEYDVDGVHYEEQYHVFNKNNRYAIGDSVEIRCNPNDPRNFLLKTEPITFVLSSIFIFAGIICVIAGLVF